MCSKSGPSCTQELLQSEHAHNPYRPPSGVMVSIISNTETRMIGGIRIKVGDIPERVKTRGCINHGTTIHMGPIGGGHIARMSSITELLIDGGARKLGFTNFKIHGIE